MTAKLQTTQSNVTITRLNAGTSFVLLMNWTRRRYLLRPDNSHESGMMNGPLF